MWKVEQHYLVVLSLLIRAGLFIQKYHKLEGSLFHHITPDSEGKGPEEQLMNAPNSHTCKEAELSFHRETSFMSFTSLKSKP